MDIKQIWPDLKFVVLSDSEWFLPSLEELKYFVEHSQIQRNSYVPNLYECEEFSISLMNEIRENRRNLAYGNKLTDDEKFNWPLGIVVGTKFDGEETNHWVNICDTQEGIYLIDPQIDYIWKPFSNNDFVYFLLM